MKIKNNLFMLGMLLKKLTGKILFSILPVDRFRYWFSRFMLPRFNWNCIIKSQHPAKRSVDIVFCFDENLIDQACVAIYSLLVVSAGFCHYNFYIITKCKPIRKLENLVAGMDGLSTISFIEPNGDFDDANAHGWPIPIYYRLMLPKLLPNLDRIIYCDTDVCFCRGLQNTLDIDLADNLVGVVLESKCEIQNYGRIAEYFNSGFLIMNLKQMRKENTYQKFIDIKYEEWLFPDQDILNIVCENRKLSVSYAYNFQPEYVSGLVAAKMLNFRSYNDLKNNLTMIHFNTSPKPWNGRRVLDFVWHKYKKDLDYVLYVSRQK